MLDLQASWCKIARAGGPLSVKSTEADGALEERVDALLLERVALGAVAMVWSIGVLTIAAVLDGQWLLVCLAFATQLYAALAWRLIRTGRVAVASAGALSFANWFAAEMTVLAAFVIYRDVTQEIWLALILWAFGSMQLHRRWMAAAFVVGVTAWAGTVLMLGLPNIPMHFVSIAAAAGVGMLAFDANRAVVRDLERLRVVDEGRRLELVAALEATRHEMNERQAAEAEREQLRNQFVEAQRLEAVGNLAGGLAHDMNNILCGILGLVETMRDRAQGVDAEDLAWMAAAAERGAGLTRSLLGFSRRAQYRRERLRASEVVHEAAEVLRRTMPKGIELLERHDATVFVDADRTHLVQALMNVCINSTHAIAGSGHIQLVVERRVISADQAEALAVPPGEYVAFAVEDDGCGMEASVRARIFEPFFTTKEVGHGTGLGLAMVWGMLRSHGGTAVVDSEVGRGSRVTLLFPSMPPPAPPLPAVTAAQGDPFHQLRVLVVDDEALVRRATTRLLERAGCVTSVAVDGVDAVERMTATPDAFDAVVLDMSMPRMSGAECYQRLRGLRPTLPIVCVSGYVLDGRAREILGGNVFFVTKPYGAGALLATLRGATAAFPS